MCIIQIGELVSRLSDEITEKYTDIPWVGIRGMRNLHAHDYDSVKPEVVWHTLTDEIPQLKVAVRRILQEEGTATEGG